jgi:hypothetical protein
MILALARNALAPGRAHRLSEENMTSGSMESIAIANRVLDVAAKDLSFNKFMLELGIDPVHTSYHGIFSRLTDIALSNINLTNMLALAGAMLYVVTLVVRTIVPLRVFGIISTLFFIAYGAMAGAASTFFLYLLSLPVNVIRLRQMLALIKKARISAQGDLSMEWLRPFMRPRRYRAGEVLFRKGEIAKEMFLTVTGKFLVVEIGVELPSGHLMGELGFVAPGNRRTQTIKCTEDGEVLTITYERLLELYFQNPQFGYYFLRLTTERLMQNVTRLEELVETLENKR